MEQFILNFDSAQFLKPIVSFVSAQPSEDEVRHIHRFLLLLRRTKSAQRPAEESFWNNFDSVVGGRSLSPYYGVRSPLSYMKLLEGYKQGL